MPRILIAAHHYPVASGRYMADAFRRSGCDIKTFGPAHGRSIWGMTVDERYVWEPDARPRDPAIDCHISHALNELDGWIPDLIVTMDSAFDLVGLRKEFPCAKVLYGVDNHVRDYKRGIFNWFDHKFLAHRSGPAMPVISMDADVSWLPCGYDPVLFTPSPHTMEQRKYDVAMIGYPYPERVELVDHLKRAGLSVVSGLGAVYEGYRAIYWNARISLCKSAAGDVAQRVFETAAMRCVVMSDPCADFEPLGWQAGRDYLLYRNKDEAVEVARAALANVRQLNDISRHGREKALPHSWDDHARIILEKMRMTL